MVFTNRPITKFCCSDLPETEIRIIAAFSLISTSTCLFLVFLAFANLQDNYKFAENLNTTVTTTTASPIKKLVPRLCSDNNNITNNGSEEFQNLTEIFNNCTEFIEFEKNEPTTQKPIIKIIPITKKPTSKSGKSSKSSKNTTKEPPGTTLDWLCRLFLWERKAEIFWILLPFLWNIFDLFRGFILFHSIKTKRILPLKFWYVLTSANTVTGIIIFYPIFSKYKSGDLQVSFVVIFLFLLFYNCYSLWIVNVFLKKSRKLNITSNNPDLSPPWLTENSNPNYGNHRHSNCTDESENVERF